MDKTAREYARRWYRAARRYDRLAMRAYRIAQGFAGVGNAEGARQFEELALDLDARGRRAWGRV